MQKFMLLHYGFEKPSEEIMAAWGQWFKSIADQTIENGGFHKGGVEISEQGARELPFSADSITGYSVIEAQSLQAAQEIASRNPFIQSIRVYEIVQQPR